jgi:hypothetical protein
MRVRARVDLSVTANFEAIRQRSKGAYSSPNIARISAQANQLGAPTCGGGRHRVECKIAHDQGQHQQDQENENPHDP